MVDFFKDYVYLINILLSILLGFSIGFERKTRSKEAGIRTHTIVCFGSALLMVVSKIGFSNSDADTARVAAQIVSGIGFLGAGMIVYRKNMVHGLTTAAGVWATAGIGMACGAGLYLIAIGSTILLIVAQCIFHIDCRVFNSKQSYELKICFYQYENQNEIIKKIFGVSHFKKIEIAKEDKIVWKVHLLTENEFESSRLDEIIKGNDFIISIERCEDSR